MLLSNVRGTLYSITSLTQKKEEEEIDFAHFPSTVSAEREGGTLSTSSSCFTLYTIFPFQLKLLRVINNAGLSKKKTNL